jgi:DNA-binding PadR family transcriptional regulator
MGKRFFRHGELHLVVLALVSRRPMHGYDLMGELGRLFGPAYRPSAGSIYPAVEGLEAEGLIQGDDASGRRIYELTPSGAEALERRADQLAALELRTGVRLDHRAAVDAALARFGVRVRAVAGQLPPEVLEAQLSAAASVIEAEAERSATADDVPHLQEEP